MSPPLANRCWKDTGKPRRTRYRPDHGGDQRRWNQADRSPDSDPLSRGPCGWSAELAKRIPIKHFIDHGATIEPHEQVPGFQAMYAEMYSHAQAHRRQAWRQDSLRRSGRYGGHSDTKVIKTPLPGGGKPNPACAGFTPRDESHVDPENPYSVGVVYTFGKFRTVNLGDFTWNAEQA